MAGNIVPHFANDEGVERIRIGVKEFNCMGARAPFDHPHVYLDMGSDDEILCPYCSTLYVYDAQLGPEESVPAGAIVHEDVAVPGQAA
jgi:uncharacterized Zn-finger protein